MKFEEFLKPRDDDEERLSEEVESDYGVDDEEYDNESSDINVQKAVVESLAADKAELDEIVSRVRSENENLKSEIDRLKVEKARFMAESEAYLRKIETLQQQINQQNEALAKVGEVLSKNAETEASNKIALLDRDVEIPDRFPGETRDHVLVAIKEAKEKAEAEGRIRRAQVLEGVMLANEPSGNLEKKREALAKFFNSNQNILSGLVIAELEKYGISYKKGEDYLLPSEILMRNY